MKKLKRTLIILALTAVCLTLYWRFPETFSFMVEPDTHSAHMAFQETQDNLRQDNETIEKAFKTKTSNLHVKGTGTIANVLADGEGMGSTQRFQVCLPSGQKVEISHASSPGHPPIRLLQEGGEIQFSGTYEWTSAGGRITNTVFTEDSSTKSGWIKYNDVLYQ